MDQEYIEYDKTLDFIGVNSFSKTIIKLFFEAVLDHLHWLCHYEEEDQKIKFNLAVSVDKLIENCNCSYIPLIEEPITEDKEKLVTKLTE